jgi:hypothetical protein
MIWLVKDHQPLAGDLLHLSLKEKKQKYKKKQLAKNLWI